MLCRIHRKHQTEPRDSSSRQNPPVGNAFGLQPNKIRLYGIMWGWGGGGQKEGGRISACVSACTRQCVCAFMMLLS